MFKFLAISIVLLAAADFALTGGTHVYGFFGKIRDGLHYVGQAGEESVFTK